MNEVKTLKDIIVKIESGGRPKGGSTKEGIPSLGGEHLNYYGGFNFKNLKFIPIDYYQKLKKGKISFNDILIVKDGATTGKVSFVSSDFPYEQAAINEHLFRLAVDEKIVYPKYLFYYLSSSKGQSEILKDFRGATIGGITLKVADIVKVPILSLDIQHQIVLALDQAQELIDKRKEQIEKLDEFLQSVFLNMFGVLSSNNMNWSTSTLGEACYFIKDGPHKSLNYVESGIPFISVNNIINGKWDLKNVRYISHEDYELYSKRCKPEKGDILYTKGGTTGYAKLVDVDFDFLNWVHIAVLKYSNNLLNGRYLEFLLNTDYCYRQSQQYTRGVANRDLVLSQIKKIKILIPPLSLQNKFAQIVEETEKQREQMEKSLVEMENLFNSIMQKAFKGELFQ
ncbi:Type I restriction-modification system, specificity subunit S [Candidatus Syntrophocurvum alkaliphilum]|uniref:Type I restriction-modification system, specificity subunit S n=1 Tax=Candidatus Syntrophocurvum alkaliphilum TaxID=2293317 RepID=A0A6I6DJD4_9FIRM|nr:restriction endonuclease subunit S [Candidatus Syntrophocurvum alkaliphilum]QGU00894.1 Type I restriction-modification system, specificity subunit S [Candidatus Syntrophocurvum alkaliphilum]